MNSSVFPRPTRRLAWPWLVILPRIFHSIFICRSRQQNLQTRQGETVRRAVSALSWSGRCFLGKKPPLFSRPCQRVNVSTETRLVFRTETWRRLSTSEHCGDSSRPV